MGEKDGFFVGEETGMGDREAACSCRQLRLVCAGAPVRVSMCHCLECQRRTGSAFGVQAWYPEAQVRAVEGRAKQHVRTADSGRTVTFQFCPDCGGTVFWRAEGAPGQIAVAVGTFAEPGFAPPRYSVHERSRHAWTSAIGALEMERRA
jgi:hypothetical protein